MSAHEGKKIEKVDYTLMSQKRCINCGKHIKVNVIMRNPLSIHCYPCGKMNKGFTYKIRVYKPDNITRESAKKIIYYKDIIKDNVIKYKR